MSYKVWYDDCRRPPDNSWEWARTTERAKELLREEVPVVISLDHDMGLQDVDPDTPGAFAMSGPLPEGYEFVKWMVSSGRVPAKVIIHSWNTVRAEAMAQLLADAGHSPIIDIYKPPGTVLIQRTGARSKQYPS